MNKHKVEKSDLKVGKLLIYVWKDWKFYDLVVKRSEYNVACLVLYSDGDLMFENYEIDDYVHQHKNYRLLLS